MTNIEWFETARVALGLILLIALIVFAGRLHKLTAMLEINSKRLEETVNRMEAATFVVADNLADSVHRADATNGPEGAAADAALRTGDTAQAIHERQDEASEALRREKGWER